MTRTYTLVASAVLLVAFGLVLTAWAEPADNLDASAREKVKQLISSGGYYYSIGQFDKSLEMAEAALKLDPNNAAAKQLKEMNQESLKKADKSEVVAARRKVEQEKLVDIEQEMQTQRELLHLGPNWPQVKKRTGGVYGPAADINEQNKEINAKLDGTVVSVEFNRVLLSEVAKFLANKGNVNVQVDPRAKVADKPAADVEVTFEGRNMKLRNVLGWVTRLNDLTYTVRDQVVLITDRERIDEFMVTAVYDISDITAAIPDYVSGPEFDVTLPAVNARRIGYGFYQTPFTWQQQGYGPFTGAYFLDFGAIDRYFMTEEEVRRLVDALIESEGKK